MLPSWITRVVLALALAVLPMQGFAKAIQVLLCHPQSAAAEHVPAAHGHAGHAHADAGPGHGPHAAHTGAADDAGGQHGDHFCCDLAGAAMPACTQSLAEPPFTAPAATSDTSRYATYLKLLQRPPLA